MEKLISWVEIPSSNFERAVKFYNALLNLNLEPVSCGDEQMACFPTGEGAVISAPGYKPATDGLLVSFNTNGRLDETLVIAQDNGAKVVKPKTKIEAEGMGYFALIIDSEGNKIGLYGE